MLYAIVGWSLRAAEPAPAAAEVTPPPPPSEAPRFQRDRRKRAAPAGQSVDSAVGSRRAPHGA